MESSMHKGWFSIPGQQQGDRTIEQQIRGLGKLLKDVRGKRVLDLGCAEGLITELLVRQAGAAKAHGVEALADRVKVAKARTEDLGDRISFVQHDLNSDHGGFHGARKFDIVLMLAILHKLRHPMKMFCHVIDSTHPDMVVLRMPQITPGYVQDRRSGGKKYDVHAELLACGFEQTLVETGHFNEWVGYYERNV